MIDRGPTTVAETMIVPHTAYIHAMSELEMRFTYASTRRRGEGLAILGESGTGKTFLLTEFEAAHPSERRRDGIYAPVVRASVPQKPTIKSLAKELLIGLHADDPCKGTQDQMTYRLQVLLREANTVMILIDEFQLFIDQDRGTIIRDVADWLKRLMDETRTTVVVSGLPYSKMVIDANLQLARRFLAPIEMPRLLWENTDLRAQFKAILHCYYEKLVSASYDLPDPCADELAFRFYCATGGLIDYIAKLFRGVLRIAAKEQRSVVGLENFSIVFDTDIYSADALSKIGNPFDTSVRLTQDRNTLERARKIGLDYGCAEEHRAKTWQNSRTMSLNEILAAS